jgi:sucrose-6F-phosphate phosphohydrolase
MIALVTDIDGTLVGDPAGLTQFNKYLKGVREHVFLVYATGRSMREYEDVVLREGLLLPDAAIINTGADVYIKKHGQFLHDHEWHERIKDPSWDAGRVMAALSGVESLSLQEHRNVHKVCYFFVIGEDKTAKQNAEQALAAAGIRAKVIISHGAYLDVLPEKCDKGEAACYLIDKMKIGREAVIVAGDSENDLDLFLKFEKGIIVSNALAGLKDPLKDRGFFLSGSGCATGLMEGMKYYIEKGIFK